MYGSAPAAAACTKPTRAGSASSTDATSCNSVSTRHYTQQYTVCTVAVVYSQHIHVKTGNLKKQTPSITYKYDNT
jgi:hypothetical protein